MVSRRAEAVAPAVAPAAVGAAAEGEAAGIVEPVALAPVVVSRPPLCPGAAPPSRVFPMSPPVHPSAAAAHRMTNPRVHRVVYMSTVLDFSSTLAAAASLVRAGPHAIHSDRPMTHARFALRWFLGSVALASLAACLDTPTVTQTQPTDYAVVRGIVNDANAGDPILGALVGVRLPTNRTPSAYIAPTANTGNDGSFEIGVYRMDSTIVKPPVDTMTVWVIATLPGLPSQGHTDSVQTMLNFVPVSASAQPSNVLLKLSF